MTGRNVPGKHWDGQIVALIPAHNEEESIERTIACLNAQTRPADRVIVIADNCTDETPALARASGAEVIVTQGNTHKKAGALNYALERVLPSLTDQDAVLVQDADTFLDPGFLAATTRKLSEGFGAAGGNFRGRAAAECAGHCSGTSTRATPGTPPANRAVCCASPASGRC